MFQPDDPNRPDKKPPKLSNAYELQSLINYVTNIAANAPETGHLRASLKMFMLFAWISETDLPAHLIEYREEMVGPRELRCWYEPRNPDKNPYWQKHLSAVELHNYRLRLRIKDLEAENQRLLSEVSRATNKPTWSTT